MTNRTSDIRVALFDVAGTLTTSNTWGQLINHPSLDPAERRRLKRWAYPAWIGTKLGIYPELKFRDGWIRGMARLLANHSRSEVQALYQWLVQDHTLPNLHDDVVEKVNAHKAQGHTVIFVSNMFADAVQLLADELGADKGLGTILEYQNDQATGDISSVPCAGPEKLHVVERYLTSLGQKIDFKEQVIAYSDSWSDHHMLGGVAAAVATYPDKKLRKHAQNKGWSILPTGEYTANHHLDA